MATTRSVINHTTSCPATPLSQDCKKIMFQTADIKLYLYTQIYNLLRRNSRRRLFLPNCCHLNVEFLKLCSEATLIWTSDQRTADQSYLYNCPLLNQMIDFLNYNCIEHWYILSVCNQQHRAEELFGRHYKYQDYWCHFHCSIVFDNETRFL